MKKLGIACALLLTCGAAFANTVESSTVTLDIQDVNVSPLQSQNIPLNQLFPSKPYVITCKINDSNYLKNQADIGPIFNTGGGMPLVVTYTLNGTSFTNSAQLSSTTLSNSFVATGVENTYSGGASSSSFTIGNEDQTDSIEIVGCTATPVLSTK
jgi:hypothetical protein